MDKLLSEVKKDEKTILSQNNELIWEDVKQAMNNSLVFASPLLLLALTGLQQGKTWGEISALIYGAALQLAIDLVRKWLAKERYIVQKS